MTAVPRLLPRPTSIQVRPGQFVLDAATSVRTSPTSAPAGDLLRDLLTPSTGLRLPPASDGAINLVADSELSELGEEGYHLTVNADGVVLRAAGLAGMRHWIQTFRQLLPVEVYDDQPRADGAWAVPYVDITDVPRLSWRGAMLDVARHFYPADYLRRFVDLLAMHKLNVLHLHLTDDQGWRMPISAYPRLTAVGGHRTESNGDGTPHGGSYRRSELTALVAYAASRGVTVVPEIEMPGHVRAALAAYPELGNRADVRHPVASEWGVFHQILGVHDDVLRFCRTVLDEVMDVFSSHYVHLGGDESPLDEWNASPEARARIDDLGLADSRDLYRWFMSQAADHVAAAGRRPIAWAENDLSLPSDIVVMPWRDEAHGKAAVDRGHDVVMAPHRATYFDYPESADPTEPPAQAADGIVLPLRTVQAHEPVPTAWETAGGERVLGGQGQLWTEYLPDRDVLEYRAFPRLSALAEGLWSGPDTWSSFSDRLEHHRRRLDRVGVPRVVESSDRS